MANVFSVDNIAVPQRIGAWRDAVCDTFVRLECEPDRRAPMRGRLESGTLGDLHVARVQSSPQRVVRTRERASQAGEAFVLLSVQLRGRTVVEQGGSQAVLTPGCLAFYDTTRPYTLNLPNDFDQIVLHLPHDTLHRKVPGGLDHMAQCISPSNPFAQAIMALAPQLLHMVSAARPAIAQRTCDAAIELMALAMDSLATHPSAHADGASTASASALSPTSLASQLHVSLRRLQEVFQVQGTTLTSSIWDMRLDFARGLLLAAPSQRDSVSTIAYRAGFSDLAHFSRRFKQRYGLSPSEFRAARH
jgi:AraC-like DNA-binding protein